MFILKKLFLRKPKTALCGKWHRHWESSLKYQGGSETICFKSDGRFKITLIEFYENEKFKATERGNYVFSPEEGTATLTFDGGALSAHPKGDTESWENIRITLDNLEFNDECNQFWNYTKMNR